MTWLTSFNQPLTVNVTWPGSHPFANLLRYMSHNLAHICLPTFWGTCHKTWLITFSQPCMLHDLAHILLPTFWDTCYMTWLTYVSQPFEVHVTWPGSHLLAKLLKYMSHDLADNLQLNLHGKCHMAWLTYMKCKYFKNHLCTCQCEALMWEHRQAMGFWQVWLTIQGIQTEYFEANFLT